MVDEDATFFPHVAASLPLESCVCCDALERLQRHCDAAVVADELRIVVAVLSYRCEHRAVAYHHADLHRATGLRPYAVVYCVLCI